MSDLSDAARKLWRLLSERPGPYHLAELKQDVGLSKSALIRAVHELEEADIVSSWMEEPNE